KKQQAIAINNAFVAMMNSTLTALPANSNVGTGSATVSGTYTGQDQGSYKVTVQNVSSGQQFTVEGLESASGTVNKNSPTPIGTKGLFISFSGNIYNGDNWTITLPNTIAANYNSNYNGYQNALTAQDAAIASAQNQITSAQNKLDQDTINLQTKQAP